MGFEPHDLRVIAPRPSSSRVVLRARQAALPKLALWKTPLAKTPCLWLFGFANPTSHARRSHNPKALCQNFNLQIKKTRDTLRCLLFSLYRAAEKDITRKSLRYKGFRRFLMHFSLLLRDLNKTTGILLSAKKDITFFSRQFAKPLYYGWSES